MRFMWAVHRRTFKGAGSNANEVHTFKSLGVSNLSKTVLSDNPLYGWVKDKITDVVLGEYRGKIDKYEKSHRLIEYY